MPRFDPSRLLALATAALLLAVLLPAVSGPELPEGLAPVLPLLPATERARVQRQAVQWARWTPARRDAFTARATAWDALPPLERGRRRERYRAWQALPGEERARIAIARHDLAGLSPETQQALRARFDAMDVSRQRGWRLGPALGADYPALQPLLAQVPADEHASLLQALREMSPPQRLALAALVQRTPPAERARLRRELESTTADRRDEWLMQRLDQ